MLLQAFLESHYRAPATWHAIGAGPSAAFLERKRCPRVSIGVNGVPLLLSGLLYWLCCDPMPLGLCRCVEQMPMTLFTPVNRGEAHGKDYPDNAVRFTHHTGPEPRAEKDCGDGLWWHGSSVHAACELARRSGAQRIIIWGVDMADNRHAYDDVAVDMKREPTATWGNVLQYWEALARAYRQFGVEVLNASPDSVLTCFEKVAPEAAWRM